MQTPQPGEAKPVSITVKYPSTTAEVYRDEHPGYSQVGDPCHCKGRGDIDKGQAEIKVFKIKVLYPASIKKLQSALFQEQRSHHASLFKSLA